MILGLLVTPEGIPLGFEVYPGNTFEGKTLKDIVKKVRKKFKVRRFIFVADRGLFSEANLKEIRKQDGEFVVGMKLGVFAKAREDFYDISKFEWLNENLAIYETEHKGDRCIITYSKDRAKRDAKTREDILAKIRKKLEGKKLKPKHFVSNKNYQKYLSGLNEGEPEIDEDTVIKAQLKDGFFGVITNVPDMSAQEIIQNYKQLWIIEDAFGEIKGSLRSRPVFHWTDKRIVGHLTLCFLAYLCEATLTKLLRDKKVKLDSVAVEQKIIKPRPLTVPEAMKELKEVRAIPVKLCSQTVWVRTDIQGNAAKLYKAAGVKIPPKLLQLEPSP